MYPVCLRHGAQMLKGSMLLLALVVVPASAPAADSDWLAAREAFRQGNDAALADARVALQDSPLAIYAEYWQLWRGLRADPPVDAVTLRAFLAREQGSYLADRLRSEWIRRLAANGDWPLLREEFPRLVDASDTELLCLRLQAELAMNDASGLAAVKDRLWLTAKDQVAACNPAMTALQDTGIVTEEDRWQRLRLALDAGSSANGLARHLLAGFGSELSAVQLQSIQTDPAGFIAGADLGSRDQRELAAWAWGRWARNDLTAALAALEARAGELGAQAPLAWRHLALAAARNFDPVSESWFLRSEAAAWTDTQREIRLRQLVRHGLWADYLRVFETQPAALRSSRIWTYWQARATETVKGKAAARAGYAELARQDDYYGLLARERLGQVLAAPSEAVQLTAEDRTRLARHAGFRRAFTLYGLGQRWEAASEWNWAVRSADDRLLLTAAAQATEIGWYDRAIYAAERTDNLHDARFLYLAPYRDITQGYTTELGLDEAWVYGLMRQESRFAGQARSSAGAGGLMQVMPTTAQWVAGQLGVEWDPALSSDIDRNIRFGTFYLSHVLGTLGHPVLATAGYNAGPRRALEWQPDVDMDATQYIESIPFSETRDYVKKVMANAEHYARIFGHERTRLTDRLGTVPARVMTPIEGP